MLTANKHTYLFKTLCEEIPQRILNKVVDEKLNNYVDDGCQIVFPRRGVLPYRHPYNMDVTRRKEGFGYWALPILKKQLHHPDSQIMKRALTTIEELVRRPEKTFEAIRIGVVERLIDLLLHEDPYVRERVCMIYYVLAEQLDGCRQITKRYEALVNLALLLEDNEVEVQHKAQLVIHRIGRSVCGATNLNNSEYLVLIIRLIGGTPCTETEALYLHLLTLFTLLNTDDVTMKYKALRHSCIDVLGKIASKSDAKVTCAALSCLSMLCWCDRGRKQMADKKVLTKLKNKLYDEDRSVVGKVLELFAFGTITTKGKNELYHMNISQKLIELAGDFKNPEIHGMAVKTLTTLSEHSKGRGAIRRELAKSGIVHNKHAVKHSEILHKVGAWVP